MLKNGSSASLLPSIQMQLSDFGVPDATFNDMANVGLTNLQAFLDTNENVLISLGLLKDVRRKILAWIREQKCVFTMTLYSSNYEAGDAEVFNSSLEYSEWAPFIQKPVGPGSNKFNQVYMFNKYFLLRPNLQLSLF
jgi:hypothetical protein